MKQRYINLVLLLLAAALAGGCVAAVGAGAAAGAGAAVDRRTTGSMVDDETIELKARQAFIADKELAEQAHLNVTSYDGVVLLSGETPNEAQRARAADLVSKLPKVSRVHNEITVAAPSSLMSRSSDSVITSKVKTKLLAAEDVEGINVKVVTENGVVYLMGLLTQAEAARAADIASQTSGVQKVVKLFEYRD